MGLSKLGSNLASRVKLQALLECHRADVPYQSKTEKRWCADMTSGNGHHWNAMGLTCFAHLNTKSLTINGIRMILFIPKAVLGNLSSEHKITSFVGS